MGEGGAGDGVSARTISTNRRRTGEPLSRRHASAISTWGGGLARLDAGDPRPPAGRR